MKVSVSLPEEAVVFLDEYARSHGSGSRSAVLQRAVDLLRAAQLSEAYEASFTEWSSSDDATAWDAVTTDGLSDPADPSGPADASR